MNIASIIILVVIGVLICVAIRVLMRSDGHTCGSCNGCSGCSCYDKSATKSPHCCSAEKRNN
jgi:hypothetical protein